MGTLKKLSLLLVISMIILLSIVAFMRLLSKDTPIAEIFKHQNNYFWYRTVGIVPEEFKNRFKVSIIDIYNNKKLINLVDTLSPVYRNYLLIENASSKENFLKAYPPALVNQRDDQDYDWYNHVAYLINVEEFNRYILDKHIVEKDKIAEVLGFLLSLPKDTLSYRIIKSKQDIRQLLKTKPPVNKEFIRSQGYNILNFDNLNLKKDKNVYYIWLFNKGLVEFAFEFSDGQVKNIKSQTLGFLGNEAPSI